MRREVLWCGGFRSNADRDGQLGGGWVGKVRLQRTHGVGFPTNPEDFTPELVAEQWKGVVDFGRVTHPTTTQESFEPMMRNIRSPPTSLTTSHSHECAEVFDRLRATLRAQGPAIAKQISGVIEWHINKEVWTISLLSSKDVAVLTGRDKNLAPDLQIHMDEHDFLDLAHGKLKLQQVCWLLRMDRVALGGSVRTTRLTNHVSLMVVSFPSSGADPKETEAAGEPEARDEAAATGGLASRQQHRRSALIRSACVFAS